MRVDKEILIKQHFWILLGLFLILWVASVVMIETSASAAGGKAKADFETAKTNITGAESKPSKNDTFNAPWIEYGKAYKAQKDKVWSDAWNVQKDMFDWPHDSETHLEVLKYYDDKIEYFDRMTYKNKLWKKQFQRLAEEVAPVQFAGGQAGFVRIMMPGFATGGGTAPTAGGGQDNPAAGKADSAFDNFWQHVPTEEECWLAQEDFWVKRELLRVIRDAVADVARFHEVKENGKDPELPPGIAVRRIFRNNLWEVDFQVEQKGRQQWYISDKGTIKNLHPAHFTVPLSASPSSGGLGFVIKQGDKKYPFRVDGEPLPYGATAPFRKKFQVDSINFNKPFQLEQDFEPANCPVRVILDIQLGTQSHRTAPMPLLPSITNKAAPPENPSAPAGGAPAGGAAKAPAGGGQPAAGAAPADGDTTLNRFNRNRYIFRTEQVRHMPVALHVVVDINHMHEVLVAMSNSRLRVQTTQVQFRHLTGFRSGDLETKSDSGRSVATEEDQNLVELAVYGIASIYERFPPKTPPGAAGAGTTPPAGATPAAGTPAPGAPGATPATAGKAGAPPTGAGKAGPPPTGAAAPAKAGDAGKAGPTPAGTQPPAKAGDAAKPPEPVKPDEKAKGPEPKKP
jgi:hypothetical protein